MYTCCLAQHHTHTCTQKHTTIHTKTHYTRVVVDRKTQRQNINGVVRNLYRGELHKTKVNAHAATSTDTTRISTHHIPQLYSELAATHATCIIYICVLCCALFTRKDQGAGDWSKSSADKRTNTHTHTGKGTARQRDAMFVKCARTTRVNRYTFVVSTDLRLRRLGLLLLSIDYWCAIGGARGWGVVEGRKVGWSGCFWGGEMRKIVRKYWIKRELARAFR